MSGMRCPSRVGGWRAVSGLCRALVLLLLSSGIGCGPSTPEDESTPTPTSAPTSVELTAPEPDASLPLNEDITFAATVADADTPLESFKVVFQTDLDGRLGEVVPSAEGLASVTFSFPISGPRALTVLVKLAGTVVAEAGQSFEIDAPPTADITGVVPSAPEEGEETTFSGKVGDTEDDVQDLEVAWKDTRGKLLGDDSPDKNGNVTLVTFALDGGNQTITLTVTDSAGNQASDELKVKVTPCEDLDKDDYTDCAGDCDDENELTYPGAFELCDMIDQNCNNLVDETYPDTDDDGTADCLDFETCDGLDNDGDGKEDEDFPDTDQDGLADCMDSEECDGLDNDGNGTADDGYPDSDGDTLADCVDTCPGDSINDPDKDQICGEVDNCPFNSNPSQSDMDKDRLGDACDPELCNGVDDNGDGRIDEPVDVDQDGYVPCEGDCDDLDKSVNPVGTEVCNLKDDDCDGSYNESSGDFFEPNELITEAYNLGDQNGDVEPAIYSLEATIHGPDDVDYYKMQLLDDFAIGADAFYLEVTLTALPPNVDYDLYLWWDDPENSDSPEWQLVEESTTAGTGDETLIHYGRSGPEDGGTYWMQVVSKSGFDCQRTYTLIYKNMG